jgi:hypothetical protein
MTAKYINTSPWYTTPTLNNQYLDYFQIRSVSAEPDDVSYVIQSQYAYRPDLLSYDLYGTERLWWVFAQRNLDVIQDPILDFVPGVQIYIPKKSSLFTVLGL